MAKNGRWRMSPLFMAFPKFRLLGHWKSQKGGK